MRHCHFSAQKQIKIGGHYGISFTALPLKRLLHNRATILYDALNVVILINVLYFCH